MGTRRSALDAVYLTRTHDLCGGLQDRAGPFWQDFFKLLFLVPAGANFGGGIVSDHVVFDRIV
jgi:hypothetical protein